MADRGTSLETSAYKKSSSKKFNFIDFFLLISTILAFAAMVFFNIAATIPIKDLFDLTGAEVSEGSEVDITPDGWTFTTWAAIYVWQGLRLLFNLLIFFAPSDYGGRLYKEPYVFNRQYHLFMLANYLLNISWLFVWDAQHFGIAFGVILLTAATGYASLIISQRNTFEATPYLSNRRPCLWAYRVLANNGQTFYTTWLTVATLVNLAIAWTYEWVDDPASANETASIVALSILSFIVVAYFILEILVFERFLRYTFSNYIQLGIALGGILSKNWTSSDQTVSAIFALSLACVAGVMLIIKIIVSVLEHSKDKKIR